MVLQSIENKLNKISKICEDCCEEFDEDYNFCPLCSNELKKESFIKSEKDNSIIAEWNDEEVCIFDKDIFLSYPHFSGTAVLECFKWKNYLDDKLDLTSWNLVKNHLTNFHIMKLFLYLN